MLQRFGSTNSIHLNASCSLKMTAHEAVEANVQHVVLGLKLLLVELFKSKTVVDSINFFQIKGQKPILKKKKNVNIDVRLKFNFFRDFALSDLNRLISILIF